MHYDQIVGKCVSVSDGHVYRPMSRYVMYLTKQMCYVKLLCADFKLKS